MTAELATLTAKGQVTVPKAVREALGLQKGDQLSWELEDGSVRVQGCLKVDSGAVFGDLNTAQGEHPLDVVRQRAQTPSN